MRKALLAILALVASMMAPALAGVGTRTVFPDQSSVVCSVDSVCALIDNIEVLSVDYGGGTVAINYTWDAGTTCSANGVSCFTPAGTHAGSFYESGAPKTTTVDSMADLKALTVAEMSGFKTVYVKAYTDDYTISSTSFYSGNEHRGGGLFVWSASACSPDGYMKIAPTDDTSGASGCMFRHASIITLSDFGAIGDASNDDTTAIQAAFDYIYTSQKCVYVEPGAYKVTAELDYAYNIRFCLRGLGSSAEFNEIYYAGTDSVTAAARITSASSTTFGKLDISNVTFCANTSAEYGLYAVNIGTGTMNNVNFCGGSTSAFYGGNFNGQQSLRNLRVDTSDAVVQYPSVNGITLSTASFDSTSYPSAQVTLDSPRVNGVTGVGLNLADASHIIVINGQISSNNQNLYLATLSSADGIGATFTGTLFESTTVANYIGSQAVFNGVSFGTSAVTVASSGVTFIGSLLGGTVTSTSDSPVSIIDSIVTPSNLVVSSGPGFNVENSKSSSSDYNIQNNRVFFNSQPNYCDVSLHKITYGFRTAGSGTYTLSKNPLDITGSNFSAQITGELTTNASAYANAYNTTIDGDNPTITLSDGSTITFAVGSSGVTATVTMVSGTLSGTIEITLSPGGSCGAIQLPYDAEFSRPIYLPSVAYKTYTVDTLPTASTLPGTMAAVSDNSASCTYGGTPAGGGSTYCPVWSDGSSWSIH